MKMKGNVQESQRSRWEEQIMKRQDTGGRTWDETEEEDGI